MLEAIELFRDDAGPIVTAHMHSLHEFRYPVSFFGNTLGSIKRSQLCVRVTHDADLYTALDVEV
jgi:hypothetical protein